MSIGRQQSLLDFLIQKSTWQRLLFFSIVIFIINYDLLEDDSNQLFAYHWKIITYSISIFEVMKSFSRQIIIKKYERLSRLAIILTYWHAKYRLLHSVLLHFVHSFYIVYFKSPLKEINLNWTESCEVQFL